MLNRIRPELLFALSTVMMLCIIQILSIERPEALPRSAAFAQSDRPDGAPFIVLFAQNQHGQPSSGCERPLCRALLSEISHARRSIDFAVYGFRAQQDIVETLVAAKQRGVVVRGVVDTEDAGCSKFQYADTAAMFDLFGASNIECDRGTRARDIMHNKFFVFDRSRVSRTRLAILFRV